MLLKEFTMNSLPPSHLSRMQSWNRRIVLHAHNTPYASRSKPLIQHVILIMKFLFIPAQIAQIMKFGRGGSQMSNNFIFLAVCVTYWLTVMQEGSGTPRGMKVIFLAIPQTAVPTGYITSTPTLLWSQ